MTINNIKLVNFRNFKSLELNFTPQINLIVAENGSGKTNILESIRMMCYGKPIFFTRETDIINFDILQTKLPFTKVIAKWEKNSENESIYTLSPNTRPIKALTQNGQKTTYRNFIGQFTSVWFSPETINVITQSPRHRRDLLDSYFCQISTEYFIALNQYQKSIEARNRVLKIQDKFYLKNLLPKYDKILARSGQELISIKRKLVLDLSQAVEQASKKQKRYEICFIHESSIPLHDIFDENIYVTFMLQLAENQEKDIAMKRTNVGPHKDNWTLSLKDFSIGESYDLRFYGSRGQKRMGLLIFTLAIVALLEQARGSKPVLLLDDVVSELDDENIGLIIDMLHATDQQSIITSTHREIPGLEKVNLIILK